MSCHDIGRGVDFIMEKVLEMYDDGKISKEAALEMVKTFPKAVHWCDGNEYEAQETLTETHCAACLKKYESTEERIAYDDLSLDAEDISEEYKGDSYNWWFMTMGSAGFYGRSVCRDCFVKYLSSGLGSNGVKKILGC